MGMMRRSDALNNAIGAVLAEEGTREEIRAECVGVLEEAGREAHEAFMRYRAEVGLPDPVRKNARTPA
jgi:metal-responsive CopG/Arc/MetJ family transcriptional regulator